jgi:cysteine protease ATG4
MSCAGDEVVYLDPHTTQPAGLVEDKDQDHEKALDASYHCQYASRMHILHMDPSVAAVRKLYIKQWLLNLSQNVMYN